MEYVPFHELVSAQLNKSENASNIATDFSVLLPYARCLQDWIWWSLYKAENVLRGSWVRERALKEIMTHVHYEDRNTRYIDIGPVNKVRQEAE